MDRVLFCSVSIGAGHDLAAQAVIQEIQHRFPGCEVKLIDTFKYINKVLNKVIVSSYIESLKFNPKIWGYLYTHAEEEDKFVDLGQILSKLLSVKMEKLINDFLPQAIVCTHAFPAGILSILKGNGKVTVPLIAVLTDFTVHPFWIHENIDKYVLPSSELKFEISAYGVQEEKIICSGLPLRRQFAQKKNKAAARRELGLDEKTTVLVMGGGLGLGEIEEMITELGNADIELQVLCLSGKNERLWNRLQNLSAVNKIKVFGFIDNVAEVMAAADFVITKPGGLTTAEVLSQGLPMLIVDPLPGQEHRNTDFLLNNGVAIKVRKSKYLVPQLKILMANALRVNQMKEMSTIMGKPFAAPELVNYLESILR